MERPHKKIIIPIKRVPNPVATVGGKAGGGDGPPMTANVMRGAEKVWLQN